MGVVVLSTVWGEAREGRHWRCRGQGGSTGRTVGIPASAPFGTWPWPRGRCKGSYAPGAGQLMQ